MFITGARKLVAASLVAALAGTGAMTFAAPAATLTGSVIGDGASAPLAGAQVVVTDEAGLALSSAPTAADGTFSVTGVAPGRHRLAVATQDGAYEVATPIVLAPGETRNVHLAVRRAGGRAEDDDDKKGSGTYWTGGAKTSMIAVLVGVVAAGAVGVSQAGDDNTEPAASPSSPE
jgi:hypothetical protein